MQGNGECLVDFIFTWLNWHQIVLDRQVLSFSLPPYTLGERWDWTQAHLLRKQLLQLLDQGSSGKKAESGWKRAFGATRRLTPDCEFLWAAIIFRISSLNPVGLMESFVVTNGLCSLDVTHCKGELKQDLVWNTQQFWMYYRGLWWRSSS